MATSKGSNGARSPEAEEKKRIQTSTSIVLEHGTRREASEKNGVAKSRSFDSALSTPAQKTARRGPGSRSG
jgi:hypothetical protein